MAYPTNLDAFTPNVDNVDVIYAADVNELQDAIESLEAKVGIDSSAVTSSHDYKLGEVTSTDKAVGKTATQTLTNKTLTSPVINVGSDATGDMYYRNAGVLTRIPVGTDNQIMKLNGTTPNWEAEATTVDASTTVKGIVELATSSEITAGTATGGTGAALVVTPDALASSTPVFNGSGLTNITKFLTSATSDTTFNNSSAENTLFSYSLAGGVLGSNKIVKVRAVVEMVNSSSNVNCTFRAKYGSTTIGSFGTSGVTGTPSFTATFIVDFCVIGAGSTSSQEGFVSYTQTGTTFSPVAGALKGSSSIDSTTSQNIVITAQMDAATASGTSAVRMYFIDQLL